MTRFVGSVLAKLPQFCATRHVTTAAPILVRRGEAGYWPLREDFDVDGFNRRHGVTARQVEAMEVGSIFGWDVPGADPDYWDREGRS